MSMLGSTPQIHDLGSSFAIGQPFKRNSVEPTAPMAELQLVVAGKDPGSSGVLCLA